MQVKVIQQGRLGIEWFLHRSAPQLHRVRRASRRTGGLSALTGRKGHHLAMAF